MFSECNFEFKNNNELLSILNQSFLNTQTMNQIKKLITVYFTSSSQHIINFPLSIYNTDAFSVLEDKLYLEKPELKHKNLYFLSGGKKIDSALSLEQNKIKDKDSILIYENE